MNDKHNKRFLAIELTYFSDLSLILDQPSFQLRVKEMGNLIIIASCFSLNLSILFYTSLKSSEKIHRCVVRHGS